MIDNKDENNDDYFSNMPTKASDDIQHDIVQLPPSLENLDVVIVVPAGPQQQQQQQQQYQDSANDDSIDQDHMPSLQNVDVVVASEQNELEAEDTVEHHQEQQEENHHREQQFAKDDVSESHGSSGEELADSESFDQNDSSQRDGDSTTEIESDENDLLTTTEDSLGKSAKSIDNGESEDPIVNTQQEITDPQNDAENSAASEESAPDAESITSTNKSDDEEAARIAASHEDETSEEEEENYADRVSVDYASKSAGALIIEKSSSFKGTSNLLNSDKDKYAIAPCEDKKKVVLSLSEDILVKTIKLSNYERFSSTVKDFQVMGSQTLEKWVDLGTYTAKAGNGEQIFELSEPAWARYLKFKMLSHHGEGE